MSRKSLMIIAPWGDALGGAETMLIAIVRAMDEAGPRPHVVLLTPGPMVGELSAAGAEVTVVEAGRLRMPFRYARTVLELGRLIRRHRPSAIVAWSAKSHLYAAPAAAVARSRRRLVWWQHGVPDGSWIDRVATVLPAAAVGCSSAAGLEAQRRLRPRRAGFVVHPGIEHGAWSAIERSASPGDDVVIGMVGRLQPWKGQDRLLRAVAELRAQGSAVRALIVGGDAFGLSPEYAADVARLRDELGLGEVVEMTGQVSDVASQLGRMDILVNASDPEPFGIVLLEGMAAGLPVVAVASGGPLEIVRDGIDGVLVPDGSPEALAEGLRPLIDQPRVRERLGVSARERAADFDVTKAARRLVSELARVVDG